MARIRIEQHTSVWVFLWLAGWLFTLGYLNIVFFWRGVIAFFIWPYYLGLFLALPH